MSNVDDLNKLEFLQREYTLWLNSIRSPFKTALGLVAVSGLSDYDKVLRGLRIWCVSFLLSFLLSIPAYRFGRVAVDSPFFLPSLLVTLLVTFSFSALLIHGGLRMFGVRSRFPDTFLIYAVTFGSYAPIMSLLGLPDLVFRLLRLRAAGQAQDVYSFLSEWSRLSDVSARDPVLVLVTLIGSLSPLLLWAIALVFARVIATVYNVDLYRVVSAVNCSLVVLIPIVVGLTLGTLHLLLLYTFMR